jgi:hypothetical protein
MSDRKIADKFTLSFENQMQLAMEESGVVPGDPIYPLIAVLAELPDELDRRINALLNKHEARLVHLLEVIERKLGA